MDGVQKDVCPLLAAALPSDADADLNQITTGRGRDFEPRHRLHQLLGRSQPVSHCHLDLFNIQRYPVATFKLLDALVDVADKLLLLPQELDPVDGFPPVMVQANRDGMFQKLLVFRGQIAPHCLPPATSALFRVYPGSWKSQSPHWGIQPCHSPGSPICRR